MHIIPLNISPIVLQKLRKERQKEKREMTTIRKFCSNDLLRFSSVNLDHQTITRELPVYLKWLISWSDYSHVAVVPGNRIMGYILGADKEESEDGQWRGLAMAVSVASQYRRQKLATKLMRLYEKQMVEKMCLSSRDGHYYIFLYVGVSNIPAKRFFRKLGYRVLVIIPDFYSESDEAAFEMVKEVAEERVTRGVLRNIELCSFCKAKKKENCSYVCLPRIV